MWQCQSQYINCCTRAAWCNPGVWLRLATHGIGNTSISNSMLRPTGTVGIGLCVCPSEYVNQTAFRDAGPRLQNAGAALFVSSEPASYLLSSVELGMRTSTARLPFLFVFPIRDQHSANPWPWPLTPLCVLVCSSESRRVAFSHKQMFYPKQSSKTSQIITFFHMSIELSLFKNTNCGEKKYFELLILRFRLF